MRIVQSDISLDSSHQFNAQSRVQERLELWSGNRRQASEQDATRVSLSDEGKKAAADSRPRAAAALAKLAANAQANAAPETGAGEATSTAEAGATDESDGARIDPKFQLLIALVERLTGRRIKLLDASELQGDAGKVSATAGSNGQNGNTASPAGWGMVYQYQRSYSESESTTFSASGTVRTADGREIAFDVSLTMSRQYTETEQFELRAGDAQKKDPLILNFAGNAAELTDQQFSFDIDADGSQDKVALATGNSGFLMLDRNGNGRVDDGRELFGAQTGDGFAELAALDSDGNGWIDEGDAAYAQLQVWRKRTDGSDQLQSLAQAGVGAIALSRIATPYDIKDTSNALRASVAASSVWLGDDGSAGTVQKIDLAV